MASICSVTFIDPSSLAIPEELRPAIMMAVSTGPSSRASVIATRVPVFSTSPYCASARDICSAITTPENKPTRTTTTRLPTPMVSICRMTSSK